MRTRVPIATLFLVLFAAGCSSGSKNDRTTESPAVPWTAKRPPQLAERTPVARRCRASDLKLQGKVEFVPGGRGGVAVIAMRNTGKRACRLSGRARVRLVKKDGPRQVNEPIPVAPLIFPDTAYPRSALLALRPGEIGGLTITWENWCDPLIEGKPRVPPSAVRITLPGGEALDADYNAVPPCLDPSSPSTIGVSPFEPAKISGLKPWTNAVVSGAVPGQPLHARRGQILRFRVVLRNTSGSPLRFDRCPAYVQQLVPRGQVEVHELNCARARAIGPGKSEVFAMQIRVPGSAPVGGNGLFWGLDPFGANRLQVHARVTIGG